jgi:hypothetical protein
MGALTQSFPTYTEADSLPKDASSIEADILEEPVSPELVLIDPVLAARARAELPDRPEFPSVATGAEAPAQREIRAIGAELATSIAELRDAVEELHAQLAAVDRNRQQRALQRRRARRVGIAVVAAAVVVGGFVAARDVTAPGAATAPTRMAMTLEETAPPPHAAVLGSKHTLENPQPGASADAKATKRRSHSSRPASGKNPQQEGAASATARASRYGVAGVRHVMNLRHSRRKAIAGSGPSTLRPPAFNVPGAPKEPLDEIPLTARAERLGAWLTPSRNPTAANQRHWLYQHEWIVTGARFGWWHGAGALRVLISIDRRVESQWGIGYRSEAVARSALAAVKARTK